MNVTFMVAFGAVSLSKQLATIFGNIENDHLISGREAFHEMSTNEANMDHEDSTVGGGGTLRLIASSAAEVDGKKVAQLGERAREGDRLSCEAVSEEHRCIAVKFKLLSSSVCISSSFSDVSAESEEVVDDFVDERVRKFAWRTGARRRAT